MAELELKDLLLINLIIIPLLLFLEVFCEGMKKSKELFLFGIGIYCYVNGATFLAHFLILNRFFPISPRYLIGGLVLTANGFFCLNRYLSDAAEGARSQ